jgi:hypothetical protein
MHSCWAAHPGRSVVAQVGAIRYDASMSLAEIKKAATQLPPEELTALTAFLVNRDQSAWDDQMDKDAASGKLDRLFEEAESERTNGTLRDWPE